MCLSIPAKIVSIEGDDGLVEMSDNRFRVGLHLLDDPKVGDYVLIHAGFAIQKISEEDAQSIHDLLREMGADHETNHPEHANP